MPRKNEPILEWLKYLVKYLRYQNEDQKKINLLLGRGCLHFLDLQVLMLFLYLLLKKVERYFPFHFQDEEIQNYEA